MNSPPHVPSHPNASSEPDDPGGGSKHAEGISTGLLQSFCEGLDAARGAYPDDEKWLAFQSESLVAWAKEGGWLIEPAYLARLSGGHHLIGGGTEHLVFLSIQRKRIIKVTKPPYFGLQGNLLDYVNNIVWSNELFADDIQVEGVVESVAGASVVISQPYIRGRLPTLHEVDYFTGLPSSATRRQASINGGMRRAESSSRMHIRGTSFSGKTRSSTRSIFRCWRRADDASSQAAVILDFFELSLLDHPQSP